MESDVSTQQTRSSKSLSQRYQADSSTQTRHLCKNPSGQVRGYSTQANIKPRQDSSKGGSKVHGILHACLPMAMPLPLSGIEQYKQRKPPTLGLFPLDGNERVDCASEVLGACLEAAQGTGFCLTWRNADRIRSRVWKSLKTRGERHST